MLKEKKFLVLKYVIRAKVLRVQDQMDPADKNEKEMIFDNILKS